MGLSFGLCPGCGTVLGPEAASMKPINVWPMLIMLIVIVFLIAWLWGYA